ncbi:alpha-ketoglutarate-dependent dioxygenase AlkB [Pelagibius litoralis]|uniref:Alpha-ketoglutarate-dependent dioxygenase AlkB n=1 Tax=Pelagibius litoralis TaxID=374515 RepID=A0A967F326_9PROT|nr:alpha-ketoglutarate-dependent dioxygenase AlkB [Pelagibius litoralis]NIA71995.1 alpha-ketoglutarate-dependent dioxygenase AlkB [Pelagibius litoralis]
MNAGPPEGFRYLPGYLSPEQQENLLPALRAIIAEAPLYQPRMPGNGKPMSVRMTNAGSHGWYSDPAAGYRYLRDHPATGKGWPAIPEALLAIWRDLAGYPDDPQCCLINLYQGPKVRMGLHRDQDEETFEAPVVSLSLGDSAVFRIGGLARRGATSSVKLHSGDAVVLAGQARLAYHGIDRVLGGSSRLLSEGGRINITLRRVTV